MAATGLYKLDDGEVFANNCFRVRGLFRPGVDGAGHWLVAHKATQQHRFKGMVCLKSLEKREQTETRLKDSAAFLLQKTNVSPVKGQQAEENVLNSLFLLKSHCVDSPSDLCSVDVSDKHLTSATEDDFEQFDCVAYINAAENLLTLGTFRTFSALRELDLAMNGIRNLQVSAGDFPHLEVLDLSYNNLSPDDVLALGILSRLRVLHLTGNGLPHLPSEMAVSELKKPEVIRFPCLEILMLDDNRLSHPSVFASLANLKRLKQLHLEKNGICEIPYLHQMEDSLHISSPTWVRVSPVMEESPPSLSSLRSVPKNKQWKCEPDIAEDTRTDEEKIDYVVFSNKEDPDRTEIAFTSLPNIPEDMSLLKPPGVKKYFSFPDDLRMAAEFSLRRLSPAFEPPLPELRYLSLADNKITNEENLLAVALFPSLAELVIHGNPLTTLRSGDPPLLTNFLQERLGIKLIRKRNLEQEKPPIYIPVKAKRKVKTHIPKIPKQPLMLGAPAESYLWNLDFPSHRNEHMDSGKQLQSPHISPDPLPPIKTSPVAQIAEPGDAQQETSPPSERSRKDCKIDQDPARENVESVFMTQVDDVPDSSYKPQEKEHRLKEEEKQEEKAACDQIPEKYRGYEELYHVKTDPDFIEPVGIQNNVRALEHALKHLLVYRELKPKLHSIQKPYIPREKKVGKVTTVHPRKNKAEVLEDILSSMKTAKTYTELPLATFLRNKKSNQKEYGEALMLLKEVQSHYLRVLEESAERAKQLEAANGDLAAGKKEARDQLQGASGQC